MSEEFATKSRDPFEADKEVHREQIKRLNAEIIRLKIKCGEEFTKKELSQGFGEPIGIVYIGGKIDPQRTQRS